MIMKISVILPTHDRGPAISKTIESLMKLDFHPEDYEIVIVDNLSSFENQRLLQDIQIRFPDRVKYIQEDKIGLSNARNCGIENSSGEIVAFLDDDAVVPTHWLKNLIKPFASGSNVFAVGGKVIAKFVSPPPDWIDQRLGMYISNFDHGEDTITLSYNEYPRGANMAFRRQAFNECGLFLDCFDRKGDSLMSYGDIEICYRIDKAGYKVLYVPDAEVHHLIRGDRLNTEWFKQRFYWQGKSEGLFELLHFGRLHMVKTFYSHLLRTRKGDHFDQLHHRGFLNSMFNNFFRQKFK